MAFRTTAWSRGMTTSKVYNMNDEELYQSASAGDMKSVRALVDAGASVEQEREDSGDTPVFGAAEHGHMDVVVYLTEECGANLHHRNQEGGLPIHYAAANGHRKILCYLAEKEPDLIDVPDTLWDRTPIMWAADGGFLAIVYHLGCLGCNCSRQNRALDNIETMLGMHWGSYYIEHLASDIVAGLAETRREQLVDRRMDYARIRYKVSRDYTVPSEGCENSILQHFMFGRNRTDVPDGTIAPATVPDDIFPTIVGFLTE